MPDRSLRRSHLLSLVPPAVIVFAIAAVFGRSCTAEWLHWDDDVNVWQNPAFHPVSVSSVAAFWIRPYVQLYVPLTYTVWGLLAAVAPHRNGTGWPVGFEPFPFHLANLVLHAAAAVGVFALLRRLGSRAWPAAAGAALFALHPLQAEPVSWVTGLKDVLSGALCVWALYCHVGGRSDADGGASPERVRRSWAASALFVAAMLAKPQAVCLPLVAVALDRLILRRTWTDVARRVGPWVVLTLPVIVIGHVAQPGDGGGSDKTPLIARPLVALDDLTFYLQKTVWPTRLSVDYAHTTARLLSSARRGWTWAPPIALLASCVAARRRWPWVAAGGAVFAAALLPTLGLVPFAFQEVSNVADRYAYLALLGPAMLLAGALGRAAASRPPARAIAGGTTVAALLLLAQVAHAQVRLWHDDERLFEHAVAVSPFAARARVQLATLRVRQSRPAEAEALYRQALALAPQDATGNFDYANLLRQQGDLAGAIEHYRRAIERSPNEASFHTNLGLTLLRTGQADQAISELQRSAELDPNNKQVWMALGSTLAQHGDLPSAAAALSQAVDIDPNFAPAQELLGQIRAAMQRQQAPPPPASH